MGFRTLKRLLVGETILGPNIALFQPSGDTGRADQDCWTVGSVQRYILELRPPQENPPVYRLVLRRTIESKDTIDAHGFIHHSPGCVRAAPGRHT
jgi:hypothetical protein